jgi:hypothetical protein
MTQTERLKEALAFSCEGFFYAFTPHLCALSFISLLSLSFILSLFEFYTRLKI